MIRKKICMLGAFAVGKTSLVRRFVEDSFSDRYVTTIGVKVMKKQLTHRGRDVTLMLWDLHGDDAFQTVQSSYLRGSSGLLLVADGTRAETVTVARRLLALATDQAELDVPFLLLINKADLKADWDLEAADIDEQLAGWTVLETSARSGDGVEQAFELLTARMMERDAD
ncbi:MAG: GTP-binding protein [Planctomycetota bacterium]|nr:GTP-binding protein [Planctomycetota bacterium]